MILFDGLDEICQRDVLLSEHTSFGLGGPAKWFCRAQSDEQLRSVLRRCDEAGVFLRVLGGGSNVLVGDGGFDGVVVKLAAARYGEIRFDGVDVWAGAAAPLSRLVRQSIRQGLAGLECVAGVPGTVAGAVKNNAGGRFGQISAAVKSVRVMDHRGRIFDRGAGELEFGYRCSNITEPVVLAVRFELSRDEPDQLLRRFREVWLYKKNTQPTQQRSAGCVFKNPPGGSAAGLIEQVGLKGWGVDGAKVSERHANFIIAGAGARAESVLKLIGIVRQRVYERFGVRLELEVELW